MRFNSAGTLDGLLSLSLSVVGSIKSAASIFTSLGLFVRQRLDMLEGCRVQIVSYSRGVANPDISDASTKFASSVNDIVVSIFCCCCGIDVLFDVAASLLACYHRIVACGVDRFFDPKKSIFTVLEPRTSQR